MKMTISERKKAIISRISKLRDADKISRIEQVLQVDEPLTVGTTRARLHGTWSEEEAAEVRGIIESECEKIDPNDWS